LETTLSRQSLTLIVTTQNKQEKNNNNKIKISELGLGKKNTPKHTKNPACPSTHVRTVHMHVCVLIAVYNCGTQYGTEQF